MKREIFFSACGHLVIIAALLLLSSPLGKSKIYPTIYQVSLISLPKLEVKTAEAQAQTVPKVTVKQEKALPKKVTAKKKPPETAKVEPAKPQEQNQSQQIEGLG